MEDSQASTQTSVQDTADTASPQLQISDLLLILQILQAIAQRGGFKVEEFKTVGECYERLFAFLAANGAVRAQETKPTSADADAQQ